MPDKVFCENCKFYYLANAPGKRFDSELMDTDETCISLSNFRKTYRTDKAGPISKPSVINKNNDCRWYQPKAEGSSSSSSSSDDNGASSTIPEFPLVLDSRGRVVAPDNFWDVNADDIYNAIADQIQGGVGSDGLSAYQIAVNNGFEGTVQEWLTSLQGEDGTQGNDGLSAYQIAVNIGFGGSEQDWITSLHGQDGDTGSNGNDGLSAYQIAQNEGFVGTVQEWLDSLKGNDGDPGSPGSNGNDGLSAYQIAVNNGFGGSEQDWLVSLQGQNGNQGDMGLSAYTIAILGGFNGTEQEWLDSLKGSDGDPGSPGSNGNDGLSAYQIAINNGFNGTEQEWLDSLQGADGDPGSPGQNGIGGGGCISFSYMQLSKIFTTSSLGWITEEIDNGTYCLSAGGYVSASSTIVNGTTYIHGLIQPPSATGFHTTRAFELTYLSTSTLNTECKFDLTLIYSNSDYSSITPLYTQSAIVAVSANTPTSLVIPASSFLVPFDSNKGRLTIKIEFYSKSNNCVKIIDGCYNFI